MMMILMMSTLVPAAGAGKERQNVKTTRDVAVVNAAVKSLLSVNCWTVVARQSHSTSFTKQNEQACGSWDCPRLIP